MKIKRLEISGFKSFADKVVLDFQQAITGVVGPNGCGKSNIVDAIRWCMGEQSAKNLRGKAMDDVIFAGSENRKPLGMAEVSLVFSTEDGRAPAQYLEFSEIQLTRRLYRNGDSEYLINKTPCRLKDITEIFMDTGIGTKAYSIIEQGKIGQILHSRPEERRILIEEAAGVTKYKVRKQQALRKIESTQQNLLRISDLLGEIRRQLNGLQRQARKAERFRELRNEQRELDLLFTLQQSNGLEQQQQQVSALLTEQQQQLDQTRFSLGQTENQLELQRTDLLEMEQELSQQQEGLFQAKSELISCENRLEFRQKEQINLASRLQQIGNELQGVQGRKETLGTELENLRQQQQESQTSMSAAQELLTVLQANQQEQERCFDSQRSRLDELRRLHFGARGDASHCRNRKEAAGKRLELVTDRLERQRHEQIMLLEQQQQSQASQQSLQEQVARQSQMKQQLSSELELLEEQERLIKSRLPQLDTALQSARDQLSTASSRLASLKELEAQFSGYGQGVQALMAQATLKQGFAGLLADQLEVAEEAEQAVEALLADRLQAVICNNQESLLNAADFLQQQSRGKAQLVMAASRPTIATNLSGLTSLLEFVTPTGAANDLIRHLLARVYLTNTLQEAITQQHNHPECCFVTRNGDLISPDGIVTVGKNDDQQSGIIHKKREIRSLEQQVSQQRQMVAELDADRQQQQQQLQQASSDLHDTRQELHKLELTLSGLLKDQQRVDGETIRLQERLELLTYEQENLQEEQISQQEELRQATTGELEAEQKAQQLEQELHTVTAEQETRQKELSSQREQLTAQRVLVATLLEQAQARQQADGSLSNQLHELERQLENRQLEQQRIIAEEHHLVQQQADEKEQLQQLLTALEQQNEQLLVVRSGYEAASTDLVQQENNTRQLREQRDKLQQQVSELTLQTSSLSLQQEHLLQGLDERHRMTILEVREQLAEREFNAEQARKRQQELEQQINELGEVNLLAIEEYSEMEERHNFLADQKTDLEESIQDLQQAIQKINRTTRKLFLEAFTSINSKFQEVFPQLFRGGTAELRLTNEQDLLETGIDIIVQPPGKKLSNVMLLSGGEKALTAVALIFSIFLIKPTPFCLLDEVDAPLDDANIGRFNEMVREMSGISQFIIITHNKATMSVADTLYGITMEEPGASRLVSVRLH